MPGKGLAHFTAAEQGVMVTGMMFGAIGGAVGAIAATSAAKRRGAREMEEMAITDPTLHVAERLRERLNPEDDGAGKGGPKLQLTTTNWQVGQGNLGYFVGLQVFAAGSGKLVVKGECKYLRKVEELGVSEKTLFEDSAAGLKREYAQAAEHCANYFMESLIPANRQ